MKNSNNGLRILMVEDNPGDQYLITELLNTSVIKIQLVNTAETIGKAVDFLQKEIVDIILLDLSLPDCSGIDTFKTIKKSAGKIPVIILSGLTDMNIAMEAITLGAQDYHIKGDLDEKTLTKTILYSIERKRKLEDLRESNERYIMISKAELDMMQSEEITRQIMNAALDAIVCTDTYGKITVWNPQAEKIFGWQQHEILGKTLAETIIPAEYREKHQKGLKHYLAKGEGPILNKLTETTAVNHKGHCFPVELSIIPLAEGDTRFFCAFIRDITERKKNEEALIRNELYLRGTLDSTKDGILAIDNNGKVITTNNRFAELWQIPQELIEQKDDRLLLEYALDQLIDPQAFLSKVKDLYNSDRTDFDILYFRDSRIFERYSTPLILNQNIVGRVWSFRDVTDQEKAEATLKASEQNLSQVLSSTADNFYVIDRNYRINLINESAKKNLTSAWGKPVSVGTNILDVIPDEKDEPIKSSLDKVFDGKKVEYELHLSVYGLPEWVLVNYMPVNDYKGAIIGAYIVTNDISVRKKAEQELEESYKAIRKLTEHLQNIREEERAHMAREIHDELGQQLTVLKMDVSWLNKKIASPDDKVREKMKGLLSMLDETVQTVRRISSELRPSLLDDLGLTAAMEWQLGEFEKRSGIKTKFDAPETEIKLTDTAKTALFRIFQESLTNVARHSDAGKLYVSMVHKDNNFVLSIIDDGKGFDKQKITEKRTLGILGMQERTSMIGGTYKIDGIPGKGTVVEVEISLNSANAIS